LAGSCAFAVFKKEQVITNNKKADINNFFMKLVFG